MGSHQNGGHMSYKYLGNDQYEITLTIYQDCEHGNPPSLEEDLPAFISIFRGTGHVKIDTLHLQLQAESQSENHVFGCDKETHTCFNLLRLKTTIELPQHPEPYHLVYQRCCYSSGIVNLNDALSTGMSLHCTVDASGSNRNSSAVFADYQPQDITSEGPIVLEHFVTDPDGDSVSFELITPLTGGSQTDAKPNPGPPPYAEVVYKSGYAAEFPFGTTHTTDFNMTSGRLSGTLPKGSVLISIAAHEWRDNVKINTSTHSYVINGCFTDVSGEKLWFYPNPSTSIITLVEGTFTEETTISICDLNGQVLLKRKVGQSPIINMGHLERGVYILTLQNGRVRTKFKILKL